MPKSRSTQLVGKTTRLRVAPFLLLNVDPSILRYQNPLYSRKEHKMSNFCLWSIFVRPALFSHRLEPLCETHSATHRSGDADLAFVRHKRPSCTLNPLTISNLFLCAENIKFH